MVCSQAPTTVPGIEQSHTWEISIELNCSITKAIIVVSSWSALSPTFMPGTSLSFVDVLTPLADSNY